MAITNHDRVGKAMEWLRQGLAPFVERELNDKVKRNAVDMDALRRFEIDKPYREWDAAALLRLMGDNWRDVFSDTLGYTERSLVSELREWRNKWAHQERFSSDDADRALDSAERLLTAVSAPQSAEAAKMKLELRRRVFDEQVRGEQRRGNRRACRGGERRRAPALARGGDPSRRRGQRPLSAGRVRRGPGAGASGRGHGRVPRPRGVLPAHVPHRQSQAVAGRWSPASRRQRRGPCGAVADQLRGRQDALDAGALPPVLRGPCSRTHRHGRGAGGGGSRRDPPGGATCSAGRHPHFTGKPEDPKGDGTVVRTMWGELAWQLGGKEAFERVRADDERATSPGDVLRELLNEYGPCLVLIDEWVSYARQLHDDPDLPAGSFETQFTFAQALTESVKLTGNCLLVVSLPASDTSTPDSPHTERTTPRSGVFAGAAPWIGCATCWAGSTLRGGRPVPRRASRSCAGGCSSLSPGRTPSSSATSPPAPSRNFTALSEWSSRRNAALPTTNAASGRLTRFIPRSSTDSTRTGPPSPSFSAPEGAAPDGRGDPQPVGAGGPATRCCCPPPFPSTTTACATS